MVSVAWYVSPPHFTFVQWVEVEISHPSQGPCWELGLWTPFPFLSISSSLCELLLRVNILGTKYYKNKITAVVELLVSMMNVVQNEVSAFLRLPRAALFPLRSVFSLTVGWSNRKGRRPAEGAPPAVQSSRRCESLAKNADICAANVKLNISVSLGQTDN